MPIKWLRIALATVLVLAAAAPAHAFRCGSRLIARGDPAEKVLQYCGEPVAVTKRLKQRSYFTESGVVGFQSGPKPLWISELMKVSHSIRR